MELYLREIVKDDQKELLEMVNEIENDTIDDKYEGFRNIKGLTSDNFDDFLIDLEHSKDAKKS